MGMKINPVSKPSNRKTIVIGRKTRKMGSVFHSGSGGVTLNGSSIAIDDASDTIDSQVGCSSLYLKRKICVVHFAADGVFIAILRCFYRVGYLPWTLD